MKIPKNVWQWGGWFYLQILKKYIIPINNANLLNKITFFKIVDVYCYFYNVFEYNNQLTLNLWFWKYPLPSILFVILLSADFLQKSITVDDKVLKTVFNANEASQ